MNEDEIDFESPFDSKIEVVKENRVTYTATVETVEEVLRVIMTHLDDVNRPFFQCQPKSVFDTEAEEEGWVEMFDVVISGEPKNEQ